MDAFGWFLAPQATLVVLGLGGIQKVIPANPNRISLWIQASTSTFFAPGPFPSLATLGLITSNSLPPLQFTQANDGILCQGEWWAQAGAGANVFIVEGILRAWPDDPQ